MALTTDLYPYQDASVDMVLELGYGLIAYEMGLGKTICGIAIVEELLDDPGINMALLVVPSGLKYQWAKSIAKFTDVPTKEKVFRRRGRPNETITIPDDTACVIVDGSPEKRQEQYAYIREHQPDYVIVSYNQVVDDWGWINDLQAECVILDEATAIKGFGSLRTEAVKALNPRWPVALTGTPLENRPEEVYSIMDFVCPGYLGKPKAFDTKFIVRDTNGKVKRYRNLDVLFARLSKVMSRKTRHDPDVAPYMPDVVERVEEVEMPTKSRRLYRRIAAEAADELMNSPISGSFDISTYYSGGQENNIGAQGRVMAKVMALQMLCNHPDLLRTSAKAYMESEGATGSKYAAELLEAGLLEDLGQPKKLERLTEMVENILSFHEENKVIVFSFFKDMGRMIQQSLRQHGSVLYNGDMTPTEKAAAATRFQQDPECRIFIASDAGAFGVDLPQANYLINYDLVQSAGKMDQRNARHVRAGSTHDEVYVINLLTENSIEQWVHQRLGFKRRVSRAVVDGEVQRGVAIENDVASLTNFLYS